MEALVKSCTICSVWSGMPSILQNNKLQIFLGKIELFCLFVACSYTSREAKCDHVVLARYGLVCPKFSETTNH